MSSKTASGDQRTPGSLFHHRFAFGSQREFHTRDLWDKPTMLLGARLP
jgi:hypothetical protein